MQCRHPGGKVVTVIQHSRDKRLVHHRCELCRLEWTDVEQSVPINDPVTADELIEVHDMLKRDDLALEDLL